MTKRNQYKSRHAQRPTKEKQLLRLVARYDSQVHDSQVRRRKQQKRDAVTKEQLLAREGQG